MRKTLTTRYDVAEHLRTPEDMAAYLEACLEEADGDAAFIAKALGDIAAPWAWLRLRGMPVSLSKACTRHFPVSGVPISTPSSRLSERWG